MPMMFTMVPLETLDSVRALTHEKLRALGRETGKKYTIRTFYLGPRRNKRTSRPASTLKSDAYAAKIAIYEVKTGSYGSWPTLISYV